MSRVGLGQILTSPVFDPGWSGVRTRSCRSKPRSKIRPGRCRTRRRASAAALWRTHRCRINRKSHKSERASTDNLGAHLLEVFRAFADRGDLTMSGWRAHHTILVWRLVGGVGKVKDDVGKIEGRCSGLRLVCPKPAELTRRFSDAGREQQQHMPAPPAASELPCE